MPQHLVDTIEDAIFWCKLEALVEVENRIMPEVVAASRKKGSSGILEQCIAERCEMARMRVKLAETYAYLLAQGAAPRQHPLVYDGMKYCVNLLDKIVCKDY
jgi:hypothetical protein